MILPQCSRHLEPCAYCLVPKYRLERFDTSFDDITHQEHSFYFLHDGWMFFEVWIMFLLKNWPFCGQIRCKYDQAFVWDVILYHIIIFTKVLMLKSESFDQDNSCAASSRWLFNDKRSMQTGWTRATIFGLYRRWFKVWSCHIMVKRWGRA